MKNFFDLVILALILAAFFLTSCGSIPKSSGGALRVLASTTFLADITQNVAGDRAKVDSLLPFGADPHSYQAAPVDVAKISESNLLILNGLDYETFIKPLLDAQPAGGERMVIEATAGLSPRKAAGSEQGVDPHMWLDPNLVVTYVENIRDGLTKVDPKGAEIYKANADAYMAQLKDLDSWIVEQVNTIPAGRRLLVTNHESMGYFAERYGFEVAGSLIPSFSSNAAPSAREMARLIDAIKKINAPVIFLDVADNNTLAQQIGDETSVKIIDDLHLESLTSGPPAGTYIDMMKYNVSKIVDALK
jgi:ABC-type Zn uptake system ZnuABC Zn-binding protein ZnuA